MARGQVADVSTNDPGPLDSAWKRVNDLRWELQAAEVSVGLIETSITMHGVTSVEDCPGA